MQRKTILIFTVMLALVLMAGCFTQDTVEARVEYFPVFEMRFNDLPEGITAVPWQIGQSGEDTTYAMVLSCEEQHLCTLDLVVNSDGRVTSINLSNEYKGACDPCFAELSYHVFWAMGFNDNDAKGIRPFLEPTQFYDYFELYTNQPSDTRFWINDYDVKHIYLPESKIRSFTITHKTTGQTYY